MVATAEIDLSQEGVLAHLPMPITLRPSVPMSDDDLMAFSRRNRPYTIEQNAKGELEIMSPTGGRGSHLEALVVAELFAWAKRKGGISFSSNGGFRLADGSLLSPDASWISTRRWDALTARQQESFPPLCPEFVIEVLSASDSLSQVQAKMQAWIANGAELGWMLDPYAGTVSIYRADVAVEVLSQPDFVEAGSPIAGFRLELAEVWNR